ncbi:MAG: DUF5723 family protein [Bacteroidota bacterium]
MSRIVFVTGLAACLILPVQGQINNTLYFMKGIPQANRFNPAYQPNCGFYIGMPLVSPARGGVYYTSHDYKDLIQQHPSEDSLITFLHPLADREAFMSRLKPVNLVISNLGISLASMGFRTGAGFFSLGVATRMDGSLRYPGDLVNLLVYGAEDGKTYTLDGLGANMSLFSEITAGWAKTIFENLDVGVRAKMFFGIGNLYTQDSEISLQTSQEAWNIKSDFLIKTSLGFADVQYNNEGRIEEIVLDEDLRDLNPYQLARYAFGSGNPGFGLDLGAVYRPTDQLSLNISVVDLAFIRWKEEVHHLGYQMEYEFEGIELNPFGFSEGNSIGDYLDSTFSQLADSLGGFLEMGPGPIYTTWLNTKLYAGASYWITPMINLGILSRTDFRKKFVAESVTASANFSIGRLLNLTLSYSYMNSSFKNAGAGFSFNVGPLNLYVVSDNAVNVLLWPDLSRSVNVWVGMNLVFGYKDKVDSPLIN